MFLTDGRANVARDGSPGRARATDDALAAWKRGIEVAHARGDKQAEKEMLSKTKPAAK